MAATDAAGGSLRLFFALWPDEPVRSALAGLTARTTAECGGRAMAASNLHATLAFLGNVPQQRLAEFIALADALTAEPFALQLDVVGYWRHNRIVWAGARGAPPTLVRLALDMKSALQRLDWPVDERPYAPHVTLVRDARRGPASQTAALPSWSIEDFVLVSSTQGPGGAKYTPLRRWPLLRNAAA